MTDSNIELETRFMHPLFFHSNHVQLPSDVKPYQLFDPFFLPELQAAYRGANKPWDSFDVWQPILISEWEQQKSIILNHVKIKNEKTEEAMIKGISILFLMLFWLNRQPINVANWQGELPQLEIKPLNIEERLSFIINKPGSYFSYIQLDELFVELNKASVKWMIMQKKNARS